MQWQYRVPAFLFLLFGLTSVALAEVADKMWTVEYIWWYAWPLSLVTLLLARIKPVLGVAAIVCSFFLNPGCGVWEMNSDFHGAVAEEMGSAYMLNAYFAIAGPPLLGVLGIIWHYLSRRGVPENSNGE